MVIIAVVVIVIIIVIFIIILIIIETHRSKATALWSTDSSVFTAGRGDKWER